MQKKTTLKKMLAVCCLLFLVNTLLAQTSNPYWALPPNDLKNATTGPGTLTPLPTNSYTWTQSGYTVQPGYLGNAMTDADFLTTIHGPNNMYTDASGNLLFSIVSGYLFNPHGYLIDTLIDTASLAAYSGVLETPPARIVAQGYSETCVVPNPANCNQYYVFTALPVTPFTQNAGGYASPNNGAYYNINSCYNNSGFHTNPSWVKPYFTIIDVSQQGSYMPNTQLGKNLKTGAVGNATIGNLFTSTSTQGPSGTGCFTVPFNSDIHYAATTVINKNGTTPYRLLFVLTDDELITYKIDGTTGTTGIKWLNTTSIGTMSGGYAGQYVNVMSNVTELEVYQDYANNQIKVAFAAPQSLGFSENNTLVLAKYDTSGTYLSGITSRTFNQLSGIFFITGIEFSPNGSYVYVTHTKTSTYPNTVERITFSSPTPNSYSLSTASSYQYSQIEIGTDGNLYLLDSSGTNPIMSKISNPNSSATIATTSLSLSGYPLTYPGGDQNSYPTYFLPDQIDQEVYSYLFTNPTIQCCFQSEYDKYKYQAGTAVSTWTNTATTQTWTPNTSTTTPNNPIAISTNTTSVVTISQELRIPAGYTITIKNMTLKFSPQGRLIVESGTSTKHGGLLILNNDTLKADNRCITDMWPGIQVWGAPSSPHGLAYQGELQMNNSQIQDAYVAILAGFDTTNWYSSVTPKPPTPSIPSGHLSYAFTPGSPLGGDGGGGMVYVTSSTFLNDMESMVMYDYKPASNLNGNYATLCTFLNNNALYNSSVTLGNFIYLYGHVNSFAVKGSTFNISYAGFVNNTTGLWSINSAYTVDQNSSTTPSTFTNFLYGIYSTNTGGNTATMSCKNSKFYNNYYGIYLGSINNAVVSADSFFIWNTTCFGHCGRPTTYGLYLDNCTGYQAQTSYYSRYLNSASSNNLYGIIANNSGAHVNCIYKNSFKNLYKGSQAQYRNFASAGSPLPHNYLGLVYLCNTFASTSISAADIYVPATGSSANYGTTYADTAAIMFTQGTQSSSYPQVGGNTFSHTTGGSDFYIETTGQVIGSNYIYYCSSGTCPGASNFPYNNVSTYVTVAPYSVSDVNCSTNPYTNGLRTTNPLQNMLDGAAAYKLTCDSLQTAISNMALNDTNISKLAQYFSNAKSIRHRLLNEAMHYYLDNPNDSTDVRVNALMKEEALELPLRSQVETAINIHDVSWANSALGKLRGVEGQSNYVTLYEILLKNINKSPKQMMQDKSTVGAVLTLAQDSSDRATYVKAKLLLQSVGLAKHIPYIQEEISDISNERKKATEVSNTTSLSTLYNQPNPFKESTTVKAVVVEKTQNAFIVITDMVGNEVARYPVQQGENNINVNAEGLNQSVMFCTLVVDGVKIKTNKMVLIK